MSEAVPLQVIGVPHGGDFRPSARVRELLSACKVALGSEAGRRAVQPWLSGSVAWHAIGSEPVLRAQELATAHGGLVLVVAGDPLFHGLAGALRRCCPQLQLEVHPSPHCLQLLCSRVARAHEQMRVASVHGREWDELDAAVISGARMIGVLTDVLHSPAELARRLLAYGFGHYRAVVGARLGQIEERLVELPLPDLAHVSFEQPNCVLLISDSTPKRESGIDEARFTCLPGRPNMITKLPVRLSSLARLRLGEAHCFWDIGSCTGSVSIEAKLHWPELEVYAFERRPEGRFLLETNSRRLGAPGIRYVEGSFPESLQGQMIPSPDAVFIGGHGGRLHSLLEALHPRLRSGARVVVNAVQPETRRDFEACLGEWGYGFETPLRLVVDEHNPIDILCASKP